MSLRERVEVELGLRLHRLPPRVMRWLTREPIVVDGDRLDLQTQFALLVVKRAARRPLHARSVASARREYTRLPLAFDRPVVELPRVEDRVVPGAQSELAARLYDPGGAQRPLILFFHGGGGVVGDLETHDGLCRRFAHDSGCVVLATDYRLAPEHPYPAAIEDARAVYEWAREHEDFGDRIALAGDSMGACLSMAVSHRVRDDGGRLPDAQVLLYPPSDYARKTASFEQFAEGFFLTRPTIDWFEHHYLGGADPTDPAVSLLRGKDFAGLPPTIVATAGFDPLRDEGDAYAEALKGAGTQVTHRRFGDLIHGFGQMTGAIAAARRAVGEIAEQARRLLRP